jgi:hypothetical protein
MFALPNGNFCQLKTLQHILLVFHSDSGNSRGNG